MNGSRSQPPTGTESLRWPGYTGALIATIVTDNTRTWRLASSASESARCDQSQTRHTNSLNPQSPWVTIETLSGWQEVKPAVWGHMAGAALAEVSRQHEGTGLCSVGMSTPVSPTSPEAGSRVNIALPRGPGEERVGGTSWGLQSIPPVLQPEAAPRGSCRPAPDPRTRGAEV